MNTKSKEVQLANLKLIALAGIGLGFAITNTPGFTIPDLVLPLLPLLIAHVLLTN